MKSLFLLLFTFSISISAYAQKFGYIDTQVIMDQMPEYQEAQKMLDEFASEWKQEIKDRRKKIDDMEREYLQDEILLTEEMKEERLAEIATVKDELYKYQNNAFGYEGLLFLKRQELVKPIQDQIAKAAETVCKKKKLQFLFDKSADLIMIYSDPKHNYTDFVLEELDLGDPEDTTK
ncbi:OmpH family outer membrane protein [Sediminitomix flava]|uniref:Periplasmic chaperone for outer membrane proteins Skp n=1 Tax=Sediminitomix flava TaxID=379075 RepID=A0A315ZI72_SEDFL|nr:OmpH family outer membrane protein [Sediminitomix flava]PWJ44414.1 periplasmic chaperone for outer membrane proteins Skp [Sediminitomix flava]